MPMISETSLTEIEEKIKEIFTSEMEVDDYEEEAVPSIQDLTDTNHGLILTNCSILFVDIRSSTELSDKSQAKSMAKIYRAFARAMSMCVYACGGNVRQIAGDRVMGVFLDDTTESSAMKALAAGRAIITVVEEIFNPLCKANVNQKTIECGVGIDIGRVLSTSVGIAHEGEDTRDLVWAGKTANVASKHTDLADGGEIFVTKRFHAKLPVAERVDEQGNERWEFHLRLKGNSIFEGYGKVDYFVEHEASEQIEQIRASLETSSTFMEQRRRPEQTINGISQQQLISNIVEGVRKQAGDLLERFETLVHRERDLQENENQYKKRQESLVSKEQAIKSKEQSLAQREAELNVREERMKKEVEYQKNEARYSVKAAFFREYLSTFELDFALKQLEELKELGAKIGKSPARFKSDLYHWKLVNFFKDKEVTVAYGIIIEQLRNECGYVILPWEKDVIFVVKQLRKEQEYLEAVRYFIITFKPRVKLVLELKQILRGLGIEEHLIGTSPLIEHSSN